MFKCMRWKVYKTSTASVVCFFAKLVQKTSLRSPTTLESIITSSRLDLVILRNFGGLGSFLVRWVLNTPVKIGRRPETWCNERSDLCRAVNMHNLFSLYVIAGVMSDGASFQRKIVYVTWSTIGKWVKIVFRHVILSAWNCDFHVCSNVYFRRRYWLFALLWIWK